MAYSYNEYVGNGTSNTFTAPPYLNKSHVHVFINGQEVSYTWTSSTQVQVSSPPVSGAKVLVKRVTPISSKIVDFQNASLLDETSLDMNTDFLLYAVQESIDESNSTMNQDINGNFDAESKRIINLGAAVNSDDAVSMSYTESRLSTTLSNHVSTMHNGSLVMTLDDEYDAATYLYLYERLNGF